MSNTDGDGARQTERTTQGLPDWYWYVVVNTEERGELILGAMEPHRSAAKKYVQRRLEIPVQEWVRTYIPRPSWDCPACGVHEGATKQPNLRGSHDWECMNCGSKMWGEPMEWDRIKEGPWVPEHRSSSGRQSNLGDSDA